MEPYGGTLVDAMMRTIRIEILHVLVHEATQLLLTENEHAVEIDPRRQGVRTALRRVADYPNGCTIRLA
jgi:hypothetical protein